MPDSVNSSSITSDGDTDSVTLPVEINSRNWATNQSLTLSPESGELDAGCFASLI